jgi:hypothetical protein
LSSMQVALAHPSAAPTQANGGLGMAIKVL